jgi:hypothetical protein
LRVGRRGRPERGDRYGGQDKSMKHSMHGR